MIGTTAALLMGAAALGSVGSAAIGSSAAKKAGQQQAAATDRATDLQRDQYNQTRADNEPWRQLGVGAVGMLGREFGVPGYGQQPSMTMRNASTGTVGAIGAPSMTGMGAMGTGGGYGGGVGVGTTQAPADWDPEAYLQGNPDLETEAQRVVGHDPRFPTRAAYANWHEENYPQETRVGERPDLNPGYQGQGQPDPGYQDPTAPNGYSAEQPTIGARPEAPVRQDLVRPSMTRPTGPQRQEMAPLDVSLNAFTPSPDYQFRMGESLRGVDMAANAGRGLNNGARYKAILDRAGNLASGEYTQWRDYTTNQYNTNRARGDQNFEFDAGRSDQNFAFDAARSDQNFAFDQGRKDQNYGFDVGRSDANYDNDRAFNQTKFQNDRSFGAQRYDQRTGNMFQLAGMGSNANGANQQAGLAYASNAGGLMTQGAQAQGQAGMQSANAWSNGFNNLMTTGAYLYGKGASQPKQTSWST